MMTLSIRQLKNTQHIPMTLNTAIFSLRAKCDKFKSATFCSHAECRYAECRYAECRYAGCCAAILKACHYFLKN